MENRNKPAFYNPNSFSMQGDDGIGLTKREYFAGLAMIGMLSNPESFGDIQIKINIAIKYADELLKQLES